MSIYEPLRALMSIELAFDPVEAARLGSMQSLEHLVVIDTVPGIREPVLGDDSALAVIETIEALPHTFVSKSDFVEALVATGKTRSLAQWLAQSVEKEGDHVR